MNNDKVNEETDKVSTIVFITGGTKSGKSEFAEHLAKGYKDLIYIALSEKRPNDRIWQKKILEHRKRRPNNWKLFETTDLLSVLKNEYHPLLIDSIGGFVLKYINISEEKWKIKMKTLLNLLQKRNTPTLIVGEQVGWSLVSEYEIGNIYIERIGELQKKITKITNNNWLAINGRAIKIDEISLEIPG